MIGAEVLSRFVDWSDPKTCVLFGDGAGAVVLQRSEQEDAGLLDVRFGADGRAAPLIQVAAGGAERPASEATVATFPSKRAPGYASASTTAFCPGEAWESSAFGR